MAKIYLVRHQMAGILTDYPFAAEPTDEQLAALARLCFQRHGEKHPKTSEPYWLKVVEAELLGPGDVPIVPERELSVANAAGASEFVVEAEGHVEKPKKR